MWVIGDSVHYHSLLSLASAITIGAEQNQSVAELLLDKRALQAVQSRKWWARSGGGRRS